MQPPHMAEYNKVFSHLLTESFPDLFFCNSKNGNRKSELQYERIQTLNTND